MTVTSPKPLHFDDPPLVEAVFDLFAERGNPPADLDRVFFADLPEYESRPQQWKQFTLAMHIERGGPASHAVNASRTGVRRWNADKTRGVLVGDSVLAYNVLRPYGHFVQYLPQIDRLVAKFREVAKPARIAVVGQRYINQVAIGLEENPGDTFVLYPRLSQPFARRHPPVQVVVEMSRFEGGVVIATLAQRKSSASESIYVLDLHARTTADVVAAINDVVAWHEQAHEAIVEAFLASITPEARRRFKERA